MAEKKTSQLSISLQGSGVSVSDYPAVNQGDLFAPYALSKTIRSASKSSGSTGPTSTFTMTSAHSPMTEKSTSSVAVFRVRTFLSRVGALVSKVHNLDYGASLPVLFAKYDRPTQSWKTSPVCSDAEWQPFSGTFPKAGMMLSGSAYQLVPCHSRTSGTEFSLLPTIGANESKGSQKNRFRGSTHFRGVKMSEGLRTGSNDPIYTDPAFAEAAMGYPRGWTA